MPLPNFQYTTSIKMTLKIQKSIQEKADFYVLCFPEGGTNQKLIADLTGMQRPIQFEGKVKEALRLHHPSEGSETLLLGLGKSENVYAAWREVRSQLYKFKTSIKGTGHVILDHLSEEQAFQVTLGICLAYKTNVNFKADPLNNGNGHAEFIFVSADSSKQEAVQKAKLLFDTQQKVMTWVDTPSNIKTPQYLTQQALASAQEFGYSCQVLDKAELEKLGLHALLAVGQGSIHPTTMLVLQYLPKDVQGPKIGLVGKGVTFDTGGLSIKPSANMGYMKSDMAGAAAMMGTIELAAKMKCPMSLIAVIPLAENSVDAWSIRPGDVISSYSGRSIEVIDTDAEGRLILADALHYMVKNFAPDILIDMATLTGNVVQSLGYFAAGMFSHDEELVSMLQQAGKQSDERVWRLPLWEDYKTDMLSDIADIKNLSTKPVAGSITAAKFLEYFVESHPKWAHLDIAGMAFADSEFFKMRSATAYGVHLLYRFLDNLQK